jgi:hypothetical protein
VSVAGAGARRKGATFERAVVDYLRAHGFPYAERAYGGGRPDDRGDIDGVPGWVIEVKNQKTIELARWVDEATREADQPHPLKRWWAVIAKRRNRPTADAYVVMPLSQFAELLALDADVPRAEVIGYSDMESCTASCRRPQ